MTDDFLSRNYADNHHHLSNTIAAAFGRVVQTVRVSLALIHRHDFDAPWQRKAPCADC